MFAIKNEKLRIKNYCTPVEIPADNPDEIPVAPRQAPPEGGVWDGVRLANDADGGDNTGR